MSDTDFTDEENLRLAMERLFFAYRDFTAGPDRILAAYGFGRAHHRVVYFVGRYPGINVGDLLSLLRITKQSLNRVLGQLIRDGFIEQKTDSGDRRQRRLFLTTDGKGLESLLTQGQMRFLRQAFEKTGVVAADGFLSVLEAMIEPDPKL